MSLVLSDPQGMLLDSFMMLETPEDVANLLDVDYGHFKYHIYISKPSERYREFTIPKKSGGTRAILAPISSLKIIQRKLKQVLDSVYEPKGPTHGFVSAKSILTNAKLHAGKRNVLDVDLADFFPSINFGRVRGLFMAFPYDRNADVATVLAQICCFRNQLPQGAPTSPIVSNMICSRMDSELRALAVQNRCVYTRYADDLTFSTTVRRFPGALAAVNPDGTVGIGADLEETIRSNGFSINYEKVRLQTKHQRQEVTGLVVNEFPNVRRKFIRQVRAMLHDWRMNGLEAAQERHFELRGVEYTSPFKERPSFKRRLKGKIDFIGMVRGSRDYVYRRYLYEYAALDTEYQPPAPFEAPRADNQIHVVVLTEGKTDWWHMKAALNSLQGEGRFKNLSIQFDTSDEDMGGPKLLKMCETYSKAPVDHAQPVVFIFDRDDVEVLAQAHLADAPYYSWGRNVYSLALPIPPHRTGTPEICVELLYSDGEITRTDQHGRRLYLSHEFNRQSGWHNNFDLVYGNQRKLRKLPSAGLTIIDDEVLDRRGANYALPKIQFANNVLESSEGFDDFDFSPFAEIFETLIHIGSIGGP